MKRALIATTNAAALQVLCDCLRPAYDVKIASDKVSCLEAFRERRYEFTFVDLEFLGEPGLEDTQPDFQKGLQPYWQAFPTAGIIVLSSPQKIRDAVRALKAGANDYLTHPLSADEVKYVIESIQKSRRTELELDYLRDRFWRMDSLDVVRTNSPLMKRIFEKVRSVSPTRTTVLLTGETGTGKGELAKLIHRHSSRSDRQFISVHCGAIPDTLLESELFGHEKGAFTGAIRRKLGKFEIANQGTIFLDEVGTITPSAQIKLLQVLQDRTFQRVGAEEVLESDVRVIAATNVDLKQMCDAGLFRRDLYYRLNVFPIEVPPLRQRVEDIPLLVETFLKRFASFHAKVIRGVHPEVMHALQTYPWPGNIRELENLIERGCILENSSVLTPESVPGELFTLEERELPVPPLVSLTLAEARRASVEAVERQYLRQLLADKKGRINETAKTAGVTPRQLHKLMTKHRLRKEDFR
jgi:DNA-binding NtrC family response regulator